MNTKTKKLTSLKRNYLLPFLFFSILFYSCRKTDYIYTQNNSDDLAKQFLTLPPNTKPEVARIAALLKKKNEQTGFITQLAKQNGFALWDKAISIPQKQNPKNNLSKASNAIDTIVLIPVVLPNTNFVNAYIQAWLHDSITLRIYRANDYANYGFGSLQDSTFNAEKLALQCMLLDFETFGHKNFSLLDDSLMRSTTIPTGTLTKNRKVHIERCQNTARNMAGRFELWSYDVCVTTSTYNCPANGTCCTLANKPKGTCDACKGCWSHSTECVKSYFIVQVEDEDPPPPTGGTGNDPGNGGTGGNYGDGNNSGNADNGVKNPDKLDVGIQQTQDHLEGWEVDDLSINAAAVENWFNSSADFNIDISSDELGPCLNGIITDLLGQQNSVIKTIKNLFSESTKFNLKFTLDNSIPTIAKAEPFPYYVTKNSVAGKFSKLDVEIKINPAHLNESTKMAIAETIIHELIHSYFFYRQTDANGDLIKTMQLTKDLGFLKPFDPNANPSIYGSASQHEQMAANYVTEIANSLKEYRLITDADLSAIKTIYPTITVNDYYEALAWGGLTTSPNGIAITKAWENFSNNNAQKASNYQIVISAEENGTNLAPSQTKCQ